MPENQTNKNNELLLRLNQVRSLKDIKNDLEYAKALNISNSYFYEILSGKKNVPKTMGQKLEDYLNISRKWFETGVGKPNSDNKTAENTSNPLILNEPHIPYGKKPPEMQLVPMYDTWHVRDNTEPVGYMSLPQLNGCDMIIKAKGDAMAGRINDGDLIGIKRIDNWKDWLPMGYIYAIVTDQAELIKYIRKGSTAETFTISSHNGFYVDDEIPKKLIKQVWSVKTILPFSKVETII